MRCSDLLWNWLAICAQPGDVYPDGLDGTLLALFNSATTSEASWQRRYGHVVPAALLGLNHDRVSAHRVQPKESPSPQASDEHHSVLSSSTARVHDPRPVTREVIHTVLGKLISLKRCQLDILYSRRALVRRVSPAAFRT